MFNIGADRISNWVFVTGVIRSGTTFVGTVLSHSLQVDYIHEPFLGGYTLPEGEELYPKYIRPGSQTEEVRAYYEQVRSIFSYEIGIRSARYDGDPWHRKAIKRLVGSRGPFYLRLAKINPLHRAAVIKDPVARMVTEFLYLEFGVRPVIIIRHPVSLAASLRRVEWYPEVHEFAVQDKLVDDYFADEPDFLEREWPNRLMESMAHWRATYKVLLQQAKTHGDWQVVTHEALSARPVEEFKRLYDELNLPWSDRIEAKIRSMTEGRSVKPRNGRVQDFKRDSSKIFEARRNSIPIEDRRQIYEIVKDVALKVYDRDSFAID